jgi:hypothetical protein
MLRLPSALLLTGCGSIFYMSEIPMAYVAADGRKIQLRAACADDVSVPKRGGPLTGFGPWNFVSGYIRNDCLYIGTPRGALEQGDERIAVWALYDVEGLAGRQPAPARLSLARSRRAPARAPGTTISG